MILTTVIITEVIITAITILISVRHMQSPLYITMDIAGEDTMHGTVGDSTMEHLFTARGMDLITILTMHGVTHITHGVIHTTHGVIHTGMDMVIITIMPDTGMATTMVFTTDITAMAITTITTVMDIMAMVTTMVEVIPTTAITVDHVEVT